jgi:streptogramin lyase
MITGTASAYPVINEYPVPTSDSGDYSIATGSDGALWFTETAQNKIGRITTSGDVTEYSLPAGDTSNSITSGPDGALWFTDVDNSLIGRITTSGDITQYPLPTSNDLPNFITSGPDGALWFTDDRVDSIGRITTSGSITEYPIQISGSNPAGITSGPDGNLWFADCGANAIGSITTSIIPATPTDLSATSPTNSAPSLTWDSAPGTTSYNIYRNGTDVGSSDTTSFTDTGAPQGTNSYYVTAANSSGESGDSNTISVAYDSALPLISYFTANNGSTFSRQTTPYAAGVSTQTINSDGSVTVNVNDASGYADSGFYLYDGPLSGLPNFTVDSSGGDFGLNLWFDSANIGDFFQWDNNVLSSLDGDTYGLSSGSTGGTLSVSGDTSFYMLDAGQNYTLSQLINGDDTASGVNGSTNVAVWIGVDVGDGGSTSATISSISGL